VIWWFDVFTFALNWTNTNDVTWLHHFWIIQSSLLETQTAAKRCRSLPCDTLLFYFWHFDNTVGFYRIADIECFCRCHYGVVLVINIKKLAGPRSSLIPVVSISRSFCSSRLRFLVDSSPVNSTWLVQSCRCFITSRCVAGRFITKCKKQLAIGTALSGCVHRSHPMQPPIHWTFLMEL